MHTRDEVVTLSDMQWKQVKELKKIQSRFSSGKKIVRSQPWIVLKSVEKVRTFLSQTRGLLAKTMHDSMKQR